MSIDPSKKLWFASAVWLVLSMMAASTAQSQEDLGGNSLNTIGERLESARASLKELSDRYVGSVLAEEEFQLELRLAEGLKLMELGDPERASVLFLDIVSREQWKDKPGYKQALFLEAQALFESGHHASARRRILQVLKEGRPEDQQAAVALLLESGIVSGDWSAVDTIYQELHIGTDANTEPGLLYARGKGLYSEGRLDEAAAVFAFIKPTSLLGLKGVYFAGVVQAKLGHLDEAEANFVTVLEQGPALTEAESVGLLDLANMAKARIHYEREEWTEALDTYQNIDRNSDVFDQALYEITWTFIRRGEVKAALRNLEILDLAKPDSLFRPDGQRLAGDLLKDSGQYEKALDTYETILHTYEPVLLELNALVEGQPDELAFFQDLVARDEVGLAQYLPRSASRWIKPDKQTVEASEMVHSLGESAQNIEESRALISELEAALQSENRYELFAELRGAWVAALDFDGKLQALQRDINDLEAEMLDVDTAAKGGREEKEKAYEELPNSRDAYVQREREMRAALEDRSLKAYRLSTVLEATSLQVEAMERWLLIDGPKSDLTEEEEVQLSKELNDTKETVKLLHEELLAVERDLRIQSSLGGMSANLADRESGVRNEYRDALKAEQAELATARGGRSGEFEALDQYRAEVDSLSGELDTLRKQVAGVVDSKVSEIKLRIAIERSLLEQYDVRYDQLHGDVELVAGEIAYHHWQHVKNLFDDLILAADVGVVDVAWLQKDAKSQRIERLMSERNKEREILEQDFEQVLKELGQESEEP